MLAVDEGAPLVGHSSDEWAMVESLPPLPSPKRIRLGETRLGLLCSAIFLAAILLPLTYMTPGSYPPPLTTDPMWIGVLHVEGVIIAVCVLGIVLVDPCTIQRTPESCLPLPQLIEEQLSLGKTPPFAGMSNIEEDGRVYCVRCLVWRPSTDSSGRTHHCNTCQRCVSSFDHHCVFFGRCIAGRSCCTVQGIGGREGTGPTRWLLMPQGNLVFFRGLLAMTALGILTCAVSNGMHSASM